MKTGLSDGVILLTECLETLLFTEDDKLLAAVLLSDELSLD